MEQRSPIPQWVRAAQQGDTDSFGRLVEAYSGAVLAAAFSRLGDIDASEDIRQDAFLVGYEQLDRLRNPAAFGTWIRAITVNLCRHWQRSQIYRRRLLESASHAHTEAIAGSDAHADSQTVSDVLKNAMTRLSATDREALLLYYFEGKAPALMAEQLGISEPALRKRLQRARERLRDALSGRVEDELRAWAREKDAARKVLLALPTGSAIGKDAAAANALIAGNSGVLGQVLAQVTPVQWALGSAATLLAVATVAIAAGYPSNPPPGPPAILTASPTSPPSPPPSNPIHADVASSAAEPTEPVLATGAVVALDPPYVRGVVVDEQGHPVDNAAIEARSAKPYGQTSDPEADVAATARSAADGGFVLELPTTGAYLLAARHPEWAIGAAHIWLSDESPVQDDVRIWLFEPAAISGTVVDMAQRPIRDAVVAVYAIDPPGVRTDTGAPWRDQFYGASSYGNGAIATAQTGTDGRFVLEGLPAGMTATNIIARRRGFAPTVYWENNPPQAWLDAAAATSEGSTTRWSDGAVAIGGEPITIRMRTGAALHGTVVDGRDGAPVPDADILVTTHEDGPRNVGQIRHIITATSDEQGAFQISDIPHFATTIYAEHGDLTSAGERFELAAAAAPGPVTLTLHPRARLDGALVDAVTGDPIPHGEVNVAESRTFRTSTAVVADHRGRFSVTGLPASKIVLFPSAQGKDYRIDLTRHAGDEEAYISLDLKPGEHRRDVTIFLVERERTGGPPADVAVVDRNGLPVPGAEIYFDVYHFLSRSADDNGRLHFDSLPPGSLVAAVNPKTEELGWTIVPEVSGRSSNGFTIVTNVASGRIAGRIEMAGGTTLPDPLWVQFIQSNDVRPNTRVASDGTFTSPPLPPGRYTVSVTRDSFAMSTPAAASGGKPDPDLYQPATWESRVVEVVAGKTADAGILVGTPMTQRIAGHVRRPDGTPVGRVSVRVAAGETRRFTYTGDDGSFAFHSIAGTGFRLTAGYQPEANRTDIGEWTTVAGIDAGMETLDIVLPVTGYITGAVALTDAERASVTEPTRDYYPINVNLRWLDDPTPSSGRPYTWDICLWQPEFSIPLPPGTFELTVTVHGPDTEADDIGASLPHTAVIESGATTNLGAIEINRETRP